jgi:membrane associated rhomboid family serine protease
MNFVKFIKNLSITNWLIIVNVIVFIVISVLFAKNSNSINYFALSPIGILHWRYLWSIILHMFSHFYFIHLLVNMIALFSLGNFAEKIIGRKRFILAYLTSGLFAGILSVVLSGYFGYGFWGSRIFGAADIPMLGASGAIFGIAGLFVILLPRIKFSIIFLPWWGFDAYKIIPLFLVGFWVLSIALGWPIGNVAHAGGFIAGMAFGWYLKVKYKRKVALLQRYFRQ